MRVRANTDPREQHDLQRMAKRARWSMERPIGGATYNIVYRFSDKYSGVRVYDIYLVDTTRQGRDQAAGEPIYLGTSPFLAEAEAFVKDHARGKATFYFRGFRTTFHKHGYEKPTLIGSSSDAPDPTKSLGVTPKRTSDAGPPTRIIRKPR